MAHDIYDYCIIGSGPIAAAVISKLPLSSSILIIDRGELPEKKTTSVIDALKIKDSKDWIISTFFDRSSIKSNSFEAKPYFSDTYSYNYDTQKKSFTPESVGFGGFSKVWGATVFPYLNADLDYIYKSNNLEFSDEFTVIDQLLNPISNFGFNNLVKELNVNFPTKVLEVNRGTSFFEAKNLFKLTNALLLPGVVAINYSKIVSDGNGCIKCGICQIGCPYNFIWSSESYIKDKLDNLEYIKGEMIKCTKNANGSETVTYQQGFSTFEIICKKLFLCGGAIGNSKILLRNFPRINTISIRDNQTRIIAGFSIQKNSSMSKDSLAEFFIFDRSRKSRVITQGQFYTNSRYLKARLFSEYPMLKNLPKCLTNYFFDHFFTALVYHSQNASGEIIVGNTYNLNLESRFTVYNRIRNKYRNLRFALVLFLQGLIVIPFVGRNLTVGGGGHIGAIKADCWTDTDVKEYFMTGKVDRSREIYAFGTASLPVLVPGPVTYMAMINAVRQVNLVA